MWKKVFKTLRRKSNFAKVWNYRTQLIQRFYKVVLFLCPKWPASSKNQPCPSVCWLVCLFVHPFLESFLWSTYVASIKIFAPKLRHQGTICWLRKELLWPYGLNSSYFFMNKIFGFQYRHLKFSPSVWFWISWNKISAYTDNFYFYFVRFPEIVNKNDAGNFSCLYWQTKKCYS